MNSIPFNQFSNQDNPETNMPYQNNLTSSLPVLEPQGNESAQEMNANNLNSVPEEKNLSNENSEENDDTKYIKEKLKSIYDSSTIGKQLRDYLDIFNS